MAEHPELSAQERAFIQASIERAEAETRRNERMRRSITWGSIAAALVLAIVAGVAVIHVIGEDAPKLLRNCGTTV